jgi:ribonuclease HII
VRDSKQLSRCQRQQCFTQIQQIALAIGLGSASVTEIDRLNIRQATALAMQRALQRVMPLDHVLVDGLPVPELGSAQTAVVKGDQHCLAIAAASVIAKVTRDRWMQRLATLFPEYGWARNVGYGTPAHRRAICVQGPTRLHRRRFLHPDAWQLVLDLDNLDQLPS